MSKRFLPQLGNGQIELTPNFPALAQTRDEDISTSTEITLHADTSLIEVNAVDGEIFLKYGTDNVTNANFDEYIMAGSTRHYVIPQGVTAINIIGDATAIIIEK